MTDRAVMKHPEVYRELKALVRRILYEPLDIGDYFPTAEALVGMLRNLDPADQGSIFHLFNECLEPSSIWHVKLLRVECRNLLDHLRAFEDWRMEHYRLKILP